MARHLSDFQEVGIDQVIFLQQAGRNTNQNICESLELFADKVMPDFTKDVEEREAKKAAELAPYIEAALARKTYMQPLAREDVPVVKAAVRASVFDAQKQREAAKND